MSMNEEALVAGLKRLFPQSADVVEGPGDDCAAIRLPGSDSLLLSAVDQVIEGIHYLPGEEIASVAEKLVKRNVSDIAAMGGAPTHALLTIAANPLEEKVLYRFFEAAQETCARYGMCIVGGDVSALPAPGSVFTLSILGCVPADCMKLRRTAQPGDLLCGTGSFGRSFPTRRHLHFEPRLEEGRYLGKQRCVHAMMDVSDGLLKDALRMASDSGLALRLDPDAVPRFAGATLEEALTDGEDYELIFAVAPGDADALIAEFPYTRLSKFGVFLEGTPGTLMNLPDLKRKGFDHFHENS